MSYIPYTVKRAWLPADTVEAEDWQRIESNLAALAGAAGIAQESQSWSVSDFPTVSRINSIKSRINALCGRYGLEGLPIYSANLQRLSYRDLQQMEDKLEEIYDKAVISESTTHPLK